MTGWEIYWFTRLDAIHRFFVITLIVLSIAIPSVGMMAHMEGFWGKVRKWIFAGLIIAVISGLGLMFIPTTKEAAVIYLLPKIANNEQVQKVPENFVKLLNTKMEEWMKDTIKEDKE